MGVELPQFEPCSVRPLFGGALQAAFPDRFQDVSQFRQVPDNQEVFCDGERDQSFIFELLEMKTEVKDSESARWFFEDLAREQDAAPEMTLESESSLPPSGAPGLEPSVPKNVAIGQMRVAKGRKGPEDRRLVRCFLANFRLSNVATDLLITFYEPLESLPETSLTPSSTAPEAGHLSVLAPSEVFRTLLSTLQVLDWGLFGAGAS
eukprot:TRINITY_DN1882_c0_g1_i2.p1 TRINITY_DN1882_c0_g1~~TRINITY_DN1882_c0_g1_i2.p1  ORF type:complete len:206 (-),score=31.82 TRINITY_DN1882_c0_g1_i2:460-1077(-)